MTAKSYSRDVILKEHIKTVGQVLETLAEGFHGEGRYDHTREAFEASVNRVFEEELVGLRFSKTEHILVPLMTDEQLKAVDGAIESPDVADGAKAHLSNALKMLRDGNPADVIRECLHAVEAQVRSVSGLPKATLSQGLAVIKKTRKLHPAFEQGLDKLYAYAGDE